MFSFLLKLKRRIKRLLKVQSESRQSTSQTLRSRSVKIFLLVITSFFIGIIYPGENLYDPLDMPRTNEIAIQDIIAPFQITVFKSKKELSEEKELIRMAVPYILDFDTALTNGVMQIFSDFFYSIDSIRSKSTDINDAVVRHLSQSFPLLSESAIRQSLTNDSLPRVYERLMKIFDKDIYSIGVLQGRQTLPESPNKSVVVRFKERENIYTRGRLLILASANEKLLESLNTLYLTDSIDVEYYYLIGRSFIKPNLKLNLVEYNKRIGIELASVSNTKEVVNSGDIIVRTGTKVNERQEMILREMANVLRSQATSQGWIVPLLPVLARILLVLASFTLLYLFLLYFRPELFRSNPKLFAIFLVFALQLFLVNLVNLWDLSSYLYPVAFLAIILTILFDAEIGMLSMIVLAILLGIMHRFDFSITLMTIFVGTVACFSSREVRKRAHFFRIIFLTALAYVLFIAIVENLMLVPAASIMTEIKYGLINGVVSSFLVIGVLPFFESLFGITTDITLLELSDMNHPLLKRLALEAPGTYHHSIIVGNLTEAATKKIGGNSLLSRVGAYYHDIGKIEIPEYFVENQLGIKSKHEMLTPTMSSIILSSHVKKGRMLGEMHDIPDEVLNFIEEHHGTMVMDYFYNKALKEESTNPGIDKFRYPGPKPQTRETGIAMLADAVEAASRTLEDPKPARINNLIQRIIDDRFKAGELDQCPLTLRDLAKIKEAFTQILIGAFHHRVAYPKKEGSDNKDR